jgi:Uma2 family endonuclease
MSASAEPAIRHHRFSVREYRRMYEAGILGEDDRVELLQGEIVEMTPIGSAHGGRVKRLNRLLTTAIGTRAIVAVQDPLTLAPDSEPQPDIAVLRPRDDFYTDSHPVAADVLLLIEVADASLSMDLRVKVPLYARYRIPEVWVVDVVNRRVQRFAESADDGYSHSSFLNLGDSVRVPGLADCSVDLRDLF